MDRFERELAEYAGVKGALALVSVTAVIHPALRWLGVERDDIVFCSSLTFIGSTNPILYQGATPVLIDSEPESWNMSPQALGRAFVAESLGATYKGKASGSFGKFGVYSFNGNKIITTSGGGMLVSDDLEAIKKMRFWATQARDPARCAVTPNQIIDALEEENIEARPVWKPLHQQPLFQGTPYYPHTPDDSVSERLFEQGLCLPSGSNLTEADQERVIEGIRRLL